LTEARREEVMMMVSPVVMTASAGDSTVLERAEAVVTAAADHLAYRIGICCHRLQ